MRTAIVWFRRDLRIHDHPALAAAVHEFERVVPVFVLDPLLISGRYQSDLRTGFMAACLLDLDRSFRKLGSGLTLLEGSPEQQLTLLAGNLEAEAVFWTSDVSPYARKRDQRVTDALAALGVRARPHAGNYVTEIGRLKTGSGTPYRVFSPFHQAWLDAPRREIHPAPRAMTGLPEQVSGLPAGRRLEVLADQAPPDGWPVAPEEDAARRALEEWLGSGLSTYRELHDRLADPDSSSLLSPYLRWGCISPAEAESAALERGGPGAAAWTRQLAWRDFYAHVLLHWPGNLDLEFQVPLRGLEWATDPDRLAAWQGGRTGYPIVDAGMRQLARTGWMHNRARLIVGSFLTKDLQLDWREGERWFARLLLDGEPAQNNGNWQWIASVGTDPAPLTRRLYNPVLQSERHDPDGEYVRRWVPELAGLPTASIHAPWEMSEAEQQAAGCLIGRDYPEPIVDHAFERRIAIGRYGQARDAYEAPCRSPK